MREDLGGPMSAGHPPHRDCPYHAARAQYDLVLKLFGPIPPDDLPFFPTRAGAVAIKTDKVGTLELNVRATGAPVATECGGCLLGWHSFRVTGAQRLAALGVDISKIMVMARWAGDQVLRYIREAPLENLPLEVQALEERRSANATLNAIRLELESVRSKAAESGRERGTRAEELERKLCEIKLAISNNEGKSESNPRIIARVGRRNRNAAYRIHDAGATYFSTSPDQWKTKCGRRFGSWTFRRHATVDGFPVDTLCRGNSGCFSELIDRIQDDNVCNGTSASSSSGSSSDS